METLTLDRDKHEYSVGGRIVPGVTSILQDVHGVQPYWTEWHARRGTAVHRAIELYVQNKLDWDTVDERIRGRIAAFQLFQQQTGFKVFKSEMKLASRRYNFAGTLDIWSRDPLNNKHGQNIIFDIKPPSPDPIVELQLGAYSLILQENEKIKVNRAAAVCLSDDGSYKIKWVDNLRRAEKVFLACLTVSNWQKENK